MADPKAHTPSAFGNYGEEEESSRNWVAALFASSAVYVVIGVVVVAIGATTRHYIAPEPEPVTVTFVEKVLKPEPPPPPPPPMPDKLMKPPPKQPAQVNKAPAAAAIVPKDMKVRKLEAPPPPKELVAPDKLPEKPPEEVDASLDKGIAVYGEPGDGDPAGLEGGMGNGAGSGVGFSGLPAGAFAPKPYSSNKRPPYPLAAMSEKKMGVVVVRCTVTEDGTVEDIKVVSGEEPFVEAAVRTVPKWRYEPATIDGKAIPAVHTIEFRFKIDA